VERFGDSIEKLPRDRLGRIGGFVNKSLINLGRWTRWPAAAVLTLALAVGGQEPKPPAPTAPPILKPIGPGLLELGVVRLDKEKRAISFPAIVNMKDGAIEYLIVTKNGKTHESLLRTEAEPQHIHLAMLLLGAKGAGTNDFPAEPTKPLPGDPVSIEVKCQIGREEKRFRADELVFNTQTKTVMPRGEWTYNGSRVIDGVFLAQREGSIVSIMTDEFALINNPRPGRENDKIWQPRAAGLPPVDAPVEVILKLERPITPPAPKP
jgi:hypothetical protein